MPPSSECPLRLRGQPDRKGKMRRRFTLSRPLNQSPRKIPNRKQNSDEDAQPWHLRVCRHGRRHRAHRDPAAPALAGRGQERAVRFRAVQGGARARVRRDEAGELREEGGEGRGKNASGAEAKKKTPRLTLARFLFLSLLSKITTIK